MKKIIVGLLVPFAIAAAGCDRTPDNDRVSRLDPPSPRQVQPVTPAPSTPALTEPTTSSGTTDTTAPAVQGSATTDTPASPSKY